MGIIQNLREDFPVPWTNPICSGKINTDFQGIMMVSRQFSSRPFPAWVNSKGTQPKMAETFQV